MNYKLYKTRINLNKRTLSFVRFIGGNKKDLYILIIDANDVNCERCTLYSTMNKDIRRARYNRKYINFRTNFKETTFSIYADSLFVPSSDDINNLMVFAEGEASIERDRCWEILNKGVRYKMINFIKDEIQTLQNND